MLGLPAGSCHACDCGAGGYTSGMLRFIPTLAPLAMLMVGFLGCTTVPETGRKQLNFLTPDQEMEMGLASFNQMKKLFFSTLELG